MTPISQPLHINSPQVHSVAMSKRTGKQIMLKMDALQPSGSFKIRGIGLLCRQYMAEGATCFVTSSGGNAGLSTAYAGKKLGIRVRVVVPETTKIMMREKIAAEGADVIVKGKDWNAADEYARQLSSDPTTYYIPPFDHPTIWEGHASLIHEVANTGYVPDAVVVCVGGGGLFCGIAQGMKEVGWNQIPIITAETEGAASLAKSVEAKRIVTLDKIETIATSLGARKVATRAFEWTQERPVFPQVVTDKEAVEACLQFLDDERVMVEPACGAGLALAYQNKTILKDYEKILIIVCGGNSVSLQLLNEWTKK